MKSTSLFAGCLLTLFATASPVWAETPKVYRDAEQAFLERTSLKVADEKCGYFTELERSALISGQLQARGELLRSGYFSRDAIDTAAAEIRLYADRAPCGDADFMAARSHLKNAFSAFIGTMVMDYPGLIAEWNASRSRWDTWRVVQNGSTKDYLFQFGLLAPSMDDPDAFPAAFARPLDAPLQTKPFALTLELILPEGTEAPSVGRILLRNEKDAPEPWLGSIFNGKPGPPPRGLTRAFWPSGKEIITDKESGERRARFTFSPDATEAIEALDPREQFEIAVFPDARSGETDPVFLTVEVGDFAAAHAFTKLPPL